MKCATKAWDRFGKLPNNRSEEKKLRQQVEQDFNIQMPRSPPAPIMTPQQAERSEDTARGAQTALQQHGLYKGRVDGLWGPMTQRAVTSYRGQNSLPATGQLDQATLQASNVTPAGFGVVSE